MARPTERVVAILRRAGVSPIEVRGGKPLWFAYEGGDAVREANGELLAAQTFCRYVREGWLLPIEVGRYRSRTLSDPAATEEPKAAEDEMRAQLPSPQQTAILRRVAIHKLMVEYRNGAKLYSYGDGVPIRDRDAERLIARKWVVPESPGLFGEVAQVYIAHSP